MKRGGDFEVRLSLERSEDIPVRWARMTAPKGRPECRRSGKRSCLRGFFFPNYFAGCPSKWITLDTKS